jgi:TM2 domain-containing membrane protein YozV
MTQPHSEPNAVPEGYEGYVPPAAPPYAGGQYPPGPQPQQPYQWQQPGYPAGPQQQYPGQYPQMSQQPMPNPAFGYQQPKSKLAAGLLGIFLGGLGIHRFYLGHTKIGVIQLLLTVVLGFFTFGLGFTAGLWGFIEGIMIIAGSAYFQRDARGIPLRD